MQAPAVIVKYPEDAVWKAVYGRHLWVLNYSGGRQSSYWFWKILRGEVVVPFQRSRIVALAANPGMEAPESLDYKAMMFEVGRENGVHCEEVAGPNLYTDLLGIADIVKRARAAFAGDDAAWEAFLAEIPSHPRGERKRFYLEKIGFVPRVDNPPYYTKKPDGTRGQLVQRCTIFYKIAALNRSVRTHLREGYGIRSPLPGSVEHWIGFSADEQRRIDKAMAHEWAAYVVKRFPIAELGVGISEIMRYFHRHGLPVPPRSVCNGCHSNGLRYFSQMYNAYVERGARGWLEAVSVDEVIRDMRLFGMPYPVYVSDTLIPLRELAERGFRLGDEWETDQHNCDHGACFV